jgi:hypothetical protein
MNPSVVLGEKRAFDQSVLRNDGRSSDAVLAILR